MPTYLLRVLGGLDPDDFQAPVFVDTESALEPGEVFPKPGETCRFRASDGKQLDLPEGAQFRCLGCLQSGYYGPMLLVERL
ncbi:MAG: hypothetical protein AB1486_09015 [Planctomycetota bacterium]